MNVSFKNVKQTLKFLQENCYPNGLPLFRSELNFIDNLLSKINSGYVFNVKNNAFDIKNHV